MSLRGKVNLLMLLIALGALIIVVSYVLISEYTRLERIDSMIASAIGGQD